VPLAGSRLETQADIDAMIDAFHEIHLKVFAVKEPGQYLECLTWKVRAVAELAKPDLAGRETAAAPSAEPAEVAPAHFGETGSVEVPRYDGETLPSGTEIEGPAVIREPTSTVVVYPGSRALVTESGNYLISIDLPEGAGTAPAAMEVQA
jgi:N-methylhydantoinase A